MSNVFPLEPVEQREALVGDPVWVLPLGRCAKVTAMHRNSTVSLDFGRAPNFAGACFVASVCMLLDRHPIGEQLWLRPPSFIGQA